MTIDIFEQCQIWVKKWNMHIFTYERVAREREKNWRGKWSRWLRRRRWQQRRPRGEESQDVQRTWLRLLADRTEEDSLLLVVQQAIAASSLPPLFHYSSAQWEATTTHLLSPSSLSLCCKRMRRIEWKKNKLFDPCLLGVRVLFSVSQLMCGESGDID